MAIIEYSTTASSNTDLFPENMAPSAVNNGMRQVQADIRAGVDVKVDNLAALTALLKADLNDGDIVTLRGYTSVGDGGGASFEWDSSDTASAVQGYIVASNEGGNGRWTQIIDGVYNIKRFGAVGDNSNDDTAAIQAAFTAAGSGGAVYIPAGTYKVTSEIDVPNSVTVIGDGGSSVIDGSTGIYTSGKAVLNIYGALTQIEDLNANVSQYDRSFALASTPSVVENDVIVIYNPTDSSWSGADTTFRAGEYCKIRDISTNTLTLWNWLYDDYTALNVDVYKMTEHEVTLRDFNVISTTSSSVRCITVEYGTRVRIDNVNCSGSSYAGLGVKQCYDVDITGGVQTCNETAAGLQYGLTIGNSQNVTVTGGHYYATRHGITIGGGDVVGGVTNRNIIINGATIANSDSGIAAADMHGNVEDVWYRNCQIYGGVTCGGKDTGVQNSKITNSKTTGVCVYLSDLLQGVFTVEGCQLVTDTDPASRGVLYGAMTTDTTGDCSFKIHSNDVVAGTLTGEHFLRLDNSNTAYNCNVSIIGVDIRCTAAPGSFLEINQNTGATAASEYIIVDNVSCNTGNPYLMANDGNYDVLAVKRLMQQSGRETVSSAAANVFNSSTFTFKYPYPERPVGTASASDDAADAFNRINNQMGICNFDLLTTTQCRMQYSTADSADAFTTGTDMAMHWTVGIQEI